MRRLIMALFVAFFLFCCFQAEKKESHPAQLNDSSVKAKDDVVTDDNTEITQLPFSAHSEEEGMTSLVKNSVGLYPLPEIKKMNYIIIDSSRMITCYGGAPASSAFNFKTYRYKFPPISLYSVYLICDTTFADYQSDATIRRDCWDHMTRIHGYLVMYNSSNQVANIINVQGKGNGVHGVRRTFDIDKTYTITIRNFELSTEEEDAIEIPTMKYLIKLTPDGEIIIKKDEEITFDEATGKVLTRKPPTTTIISPDGIKKID